MLSPNTISTSFFMPALIWEEIQKMIDPKFQAPSSHSTCVSVYCFCSIFTIKYNTKLDLAAIYGFKFCKKRGQGVQKMIPLHV